MPTSLPRYSDAEIMRRIDACPKLASLQSINRALAGLVSAEQSFNSQIAEIIRRDPSLTARLLRMVNSRSGGTDLDKKKLLEKIPTSMRRLRRLGMITALGNGDKFRVNESVFRFAADVRSDEDPRAVQLRMIQEGEAIFHDDEMPSSDSLFDDIEADLDEEQLDLEV